MSFFQMDNDSPLRYKSLTMSVNLQSALKEWAIVVEALARGEQILILRKGGICEEREGFQVEHRQFWLFPTQYHEAEQSIIPSKRPLLREIAAGNQTEFVPVTHYATVDTVVHVTDPEVLPRLQGRHIWAEHVLRDRFQYGRQPGLHALIVRVYQRPTPVRIPVLASYGGCRSWIDLETPLSTDGCTPVLADAEFISQRDEINELLSPHALAHS